MNETAKRAFLKDVVPIDVKPTVKALSEPIGNPKYDKTIVGKDGTKTVVDVYRVLEAFNVTNPQLQHLIKKALQVGDRGHKDTREDYVDIQHSAESALIMHDQKEA